MQGASACRVHQGIECLLLVAQPLLGECPAAVADVDSVADAATQDLRSLPPSLLPCSLVLVVTYPRYQTKEEVIPTETPSTIADIELRGWP